MSPKDIIRAWKDAGFRATLSKEALAELPENPAGFVELSDIEMYTAVGAQGLTEGNDCMTVGNNCQTNEETCVTQTSCTVDPVIYTCGFECSSDGSCGGTVGCTLDECGITSAICNSPACTFVPVHC